MTFTIVFRLRARTEMIGPLCRDWEMDPRKMPWEACMHDSCWKIATGARE